MRLDSLDSNVVKSTTLTNDLGEFRFAHLAQGQYYLSSAPLRQTGPSDPVQPPRPESELVRTFYPSAKSVTDASKLPLKAGEDVEGLTLTMQRGTRYHLSGKIVGEYEAASVGVSIGPDDEEQIFMALRQGGIGRDGSFDFGLLDPGIYRLTFNAQYKGASLIFTQSVSLEDRDFTKLIVEVPRPFSVNGRVDLENSAKSPSALEERLVELKLDGTGHFLVPSTKAVWTSSSEYKFPDLTPGSYVLRSSTKPGYYVKAICSDVCSESNILDLRNGAPKSELKIVISHDEGQITGSLGLDGDGQPNLGYVFFFARSNPGRRFLATTDAGGQFSQSLPPDQYYVAAYRSFNYALLDGAFNLDTHGFESTELSAGENKSLVLRFRD